MKSSLSDWIFSPPAMPMRPMTANMPSTMNTAPIMRTRIV